MSDGNTHLEASLFLAVAFSAGAIVYREVGLLECAGGALVGIFVSPDLDLSNEGIVQGRFIKRKFGKFALNLWKRFWRGYSSSTKHGMWLSHSPIFSTFVRVSYIYYFLILIPHIVVFLLFSPNWNLMFILEFYIRIFFSSMFFFGLASSDLIHICLDFMTKEKKK